MEEAGAVERKMTETERQLRSARAELENKSNSKGMAGGAATILGARDRGEIKGIIGQLLNCVRQLIRNMKPLSLPHSEEQ